MRELPENIYVLNKPGDDITVIHMNNEINIFGKYTSIKTTQFVTYPPINDEPKTIANEDAYWRNAIIGTLVTVALGAAAIAVVATATVVTGGVALAAIALAGAAVGTGLVTAGAAKADRESGNARDTSDFLMQLVTGGAIGAFVGATFYSIAPVLPQASSLMSAGICAEFGISSAAAGTALSYGITGVGAMALTGNTMLSYDQIYAMGSGESFLLDTLFDGDQNAYDTATVVCDSLTMGYMDMCMQYYAASAGTSTAVADDVDDGTGQGTTGSAKLNTSASTADDGVEQPKTTNSKVAGVAGDNADTPETAKPKTTNTTDDGAEASGTGASGKKSGLYMEEGESLERDTSIRGYFNFADGMSPEDAARYIANNEKAFFNEFYERASAAGLSDTQITEAFKAMRAGDYTKMVTYFDTSSPIDGAVFWSGNKEGAAAYANSIGGTIMEQTTGGQVFDNWRGLQGMYPEWDTGTALDQKSIWNVLSAQYAEGAVGDVTYVHIMRDGKPYYGAVWNDIEKKILLQNMLDGKVTNISEVIIDAK